MKINNPIKDLRKRFKDKIHSQVSLYKNNTYHSTREELHRSFGQIFSIRKKLSILKK